MVIRLILGALLLSSATVAMADGTVFPLGVVDRSRYTGPQWEEMVEEAQRAPGPYEPSLIGGTVANPADWPASPWVGNCSSTVIGPQVLITASHCVSDGGTKTFTIGTTRYSGKCTHHPEYAKNATADWALCKVDKVVTGIPYEVVAKTSEILCQAGKTFTWTGYGCTKWGGKLDGKFRVGNANAIRCPSSNNYDTVTKGAVAVCSGDSGGGGYLTSSSGRRVVGTNSRSNTTDTSYVVSTYVNAFQGWAKSWASSNRVTICGIVGNPANCRDGSGPIPDPEPDPQPKPSCDAEMSNLDNTYRQLGAANAAMKSCLSK